jgi:hypothetical protein
MVAKVSKLQVPAARYEIVEKLGQGAMGEVFLARDKELQRKVALKFIRAAGPEDESARKRLLREARAAAALDHPFIGKIFDTGQMEGRTGLDSAARRDSGDCSVIAATVPPERPGPPPPRHCRCPHRNRRVRRRGCRPHGSSACSPASLTPVAGCCCGCHTPRRHPHRPDAPEAFPARSPRVGGHVNHQGRAGSLAGRLHKEHSPVA